MKPPIRVHAPSARSMSLKKALLVYDGGFGSYVSVHDVTGGAKAPRLGAGKPLEKHDLRRILQRAGQDVGMQGWLPADALFVSPSTLAWWRPAAPAPAFFGAGSIASKARQGVPPHPSLVFAVSGDRWFVWAIAGDARPHGQTKLCQAPFLNVYETGEICVGNVKLPRSIAPETTRAFEEAFFLSRYTHANASDLCVHEGGIAALWRELLDGKYTRFPDGALFETDTTLDAALRRANREEPDYGA